MAPSDGNTFNARASSSAVEPRPSRANRPRRRWLRFSLRTLLLLVTILCIWLGVKVNQARRQKEAVAALESVGMHFYYAHQRDDSYPHGIAPGRELDVPEWLDKLAGYDFFRTVISVQGSTPVSDYDLAHLAGLPYIERLHVTGYGINVLDWELDQLRRPDRVIAPGARGNNVSDAGLAHLRRPDRLVTFGARDTLTGDGFVKRLQGATRLESLELPQSRITDEGLLAIRNLAKLKRLSLWDTNITDAGMAALRNMTALESLELDRTEITDAGLIHLKNAKRLRYLSLRRTSVTDAGLSHLHGLPALRCIILENTPVTQDGIAELKAATPALRFVGEQQASRFWQEEEMVEMSKLRKLRPPRRAPKSPTLRLPSQNKVAAGD